MERGTGEPLVLLRGGLLTIELTFGPVLAALAEDRRVIGIELQGHSGTADVDRDEFTIADLGSDVVGVLLGSAQVDVVGFSLGVADPGPVRGDLPQGPAGAVPRARLDRRSAARDHDARAARVRRPRRRPAARLEVPELIPDSQLAVLPDHVHQQVPRWPLITPIVRRFLAGLIDLTARRARRCGAVG